VEEKGENFEKNWEKNKQKRKEKKPTKLPNVPIYVFPPGRKKKEAMKSWKLK